MKFYLYKNRGGGGVSHAEGGRATQRFHPLKGGGGGANSFGPATFPIL